MPIPRVLQILDVLANVFSHCEDESNQQNVLVCKRWSKIALAVLWYRIEALERLLQLFGQLKKVRCNGRISFRFVKTPTFATWQRFEKVYQNKINVLSFGKPDTAYIPALITISRIRAQGPLLPKLHTLEWYGLSGLGLEEPCVMFMHNGIQKFRLEVDDDSKSESTDSITSYCAAIGARMPQLSFLEILLPPLQKYQQPILALTQQLLDLEHLCIPPFRDPTAILSGLRDIEPGRLKLLDTHQVYLGTKHENAASSILIGPHKSTGFKCLQTLELSCTYSFAALLFQNIASSHNMRDISLSSDRVESSHDIRILISEIVCNFSCLTSLRLTHLAILDCLPSQPLANDMIGLGDLMPLLNHQQNLDMRFFNLESLYPPALDDEDIEMIAKSWPHITGFWLCEQPVVLYPEREKRITLKALLHFSHHCPQISEIGLYVDATSHVPDFSSSHFVPSRSIAKLQFGPSPIDHPTHVARALAQLCSPNLELAFGCSEWTDPDNISPKINGLWKSKWEAVQEALEVMVLMQQKIDDLKDKVEKLQSMAVDEIATMASGGSYKPSKMSITPRAFCARDWVAKNPAGTAAQFSAYWESMKDGDVGKKYADLARAVSKVIGKHVSRTKTTKESRSI
ncbi:hypothetical protein BT96DRAFT_1020340 [Gymnopus androsaceus JB14]|uniref:F-box domain-containing protein n=1 Tax=Gymnopus androsaceus JB14 TaxID=1447944 RepID=A0A6A4HHF6_9AGAR|nr:hypothetical protein BT96DRAFT_1020340 [Gymnopus androsaceus JB14]